MRPHSVWSMNFCDVSSGRLRYPAATWSPPKHSSPTVPSGTGLSPSRRRTNADVFSMVCPRCLIACPGAIFLTVQMFVVSDGPYPVLVSCCAGRIKRARYPTLVELCHPALSDSVGHGFTSRHEEFHFWNVPRVDKASHGWCHAEVRDVQPPDGSLEILEQFVVGGGAKTHPLGPCEEDLKHGDVKRLRAGLQQSGVLLDRIPA